MDRTGTYYVAHLLHSVELEDVDNLRCFVNVIEFFNDECFASPNMIRAIVKSGQVFWLPLDSIRYIEEINPNIPMADRVRMGLKGSLTEIEDKAGWVPEPMIEGVESVEVSPPHPSLSPRPGEPRD